MAKFKIDEVVKILEKNFEKYKTPIVTEIARREAYETLIRTMRESQNSDNDVSVTLSSTLQSEEVQKAVNNYKAADKLLKELTGRLQHMEKQ